MITFENVSFGYGRRQNVFTGLNLSLREGFIHGLLGCNGIGKSTLLRLACGLLTPDQGRITIDNQIPQQRNVSLLSELMLVPEELTLPNIPLNRFAEITSVFYPAYSAEAFAEYCTTLKINPVEKPIQMSMGQRKKSYIAFAMACNPRILLLDEPTNGLDIPSKATLRRLLASYTDKQRTVVISTHQIREVETLIDNVVIFDEQGLVLTATTEELSRRLLFGPLPSNAEYLYSEASLSGTEGIAPNTTGEESRPNIELLFTALTHDRTTISSILHKKSNSHE